MMAEQRTRRATKIYQCRDKHIYHIITQNSTTIQNVGLKYSHHLIHVGVLISMDQSLEGPLSALG